MTSANARSSRLARWEERQQAKFDRQRAGAASDGDAPSTDVVGVTSPSGRRYDVRAVPRGRILWSLWFSVDAEGLAAVIAFGLNLVLGVVRVAGWLVSRRARGWTVGVVRQGRIVDVRQVVWHRSTPDRAEAILLVADVADAIRAGTLDVRSRLSPRRKL